MEAPPLIASSAFSTACSGIHQILRIIKIRAGVYAALCNWCLNLRKHDAFLLQFFRNDLKAALFNLCRKNIFYLYFSMSLRDYFSVYSTFSSFLFIVRHSPHLIFFLTTKLCHRQLLFAYFGIYSSLRIHSNSEKIISAFP